MKGNFVAKHMNTFNRNSVHKNLKKENLNNWSELDKEELNNNMFNKFKNLSKKDQEAFLQGTFSFEKNKPDEEHYKYTEGFDMLNHLQLENGDLIQMLENDEIDVLIHQCNCFQTIGEGISSGIARAIGDKYPEVMQADLEYTKGDINQLGNYKIIPVITKSGNTKHIVNLYSQYSYGNQYGTPTSYLAMQRGLQLLSNELSILFDSNTRYATYQLGCNRGGADWNIVELFLLDFKQTHNNLRIII